ncbi:O-antigen ligase family protein [Spirosoma aerophilum]
MIKTDVLPTAWEKLFAMVGLFCFSGAVQRLFMVGTGDVIDASAGNPAFQVLWFSIYGLTLCLLLFKTRALPTVLNFNPLILVFLLYLAGSVFWSQALEITVRRTTGIWGPTLFAFYLICRFELASLLKLTALALSLAAIGSLLFGFILPEQGIMHDESPELQGAWCGLFTHKNSLGQVMLGNAIINLALWRLKNVKLALVGLLLAVVLIILSRSTTSLILLSIAFTFPLLQRFLHSPVKIQYIAFILIFSLVIALAIVDTSAENIIVKLTGKDLTFTGRVDLWDMVVKSMSEKPLTGYGYGAFWLGEVGESGKINSVLDLTYDTAHNGYLDMMLDLGIIGLLLFLITFLTYLVSFFTNFFIQRKEEYYWGFTFLFIQLVYNFFEGNLVKPNNLFWILFLFVITSYHITFVKTTRPYQLV